MSGRIEATEQLLEAPRLNEETIAAAQRTVAQHATDAEDLERLLDMLGIRAVPESPPEPEPAPAAGHSTAPRRGNRRRSTAPRNPDRPAFRPAADEHVPVADLMAVIDRLQYATGWSRREIAKRAGVNISTLTGTCAPSHPHDFVRKDMYIAVLRLAQEHGA